MFGLCLLAARGVAAAPTVVVLRAPNGHGSWRAAEGRTGDELRAMGLRVEEVRALPVEVPRILAEGARAVVRIERVSAGASVEIWVADGLVGARRVVLAEVAVEGGEAVATAALRAAEQVMVGLTEVDAAAATVAGPVGVGVPDDGAGPGVGRPGVGGPDDVAGSGVGVPDDVAGPAGVGRPDDVAAGVVEAVGGGATAAGTHANAAPTRTVVIPVQARGRPRVEDAGDGTVDRRGVVEEARPAGRAAQARLRGLVQVATLAGPGGVGALGELALALRVGVSPRVSIDPTVSAAVAPARVQAEDGAIRVGDVAGELMLGVAPGRVGARVGPRLAVGGGGAAAWARGQARSPLQGATDVVAIGVLAANVGVAIRVRERMRVVLAAGIRVLLAPVVVRVRDEEVARLGPVVIRGSVGLEWDWSRR